MNETTTKILMVLISHEILYNVTGKIPEIKNEKVSNAATESFVFEPCLCADNWVWRGRNYPKLAQFSSATRFGKKRPNSFAEPGKLRISRVRAPYSR